MDFVKKFANENMASSQRQDQGQNQSQTQEGQQQQQNSNNKQGMGGFLSGLGDRFNSAAGGGKESEKNEDMLDKGLQLLPSRYIFQFLQ